MAKFTVTGMSCAACSARVEKAVCALEGVEECAVNLLTNSMIVKGNADATAVISAVEKAGYAAFLQGQEKAQPKTIEKKSNINAMLARLIASLVFLLPLMYLSMGHTMLSFPLPKFFVDYPAAIALLQMILAAAVLVINQKFFINGFKGLVHSAPNMDTLVALGSAAAFIYSTAELFLMIGSAATHNRLHNLYFESSAMILTLITVGKILEAYSKGKTTSAITALVNMSPKTATLIKENGEVIVPAEGVNVGDIFIVKPGESIPVDGVIIEGATAIDESALTGESIPADKTAGAQVSAATINISGFIKCRATHVGENTSLSRIIRLVSDAAASKAPIAKVADKVSGVFVPVVLIIAVITFIIWMLCGRTAGFALARAISVLVISCPCALGLATPVAIMVGNGVGAKNGILFKTAQSLEMAGKAKIVALDKTGTITKGNPEVTDIFPSEFCSENQLLSFAAALECKSEHPLAKAIIKKAEGIAFDNLPIDNFKAIPGGGIEAAGGGKTYFAGNYRFVSKYIQIPNEALKLSEELSSSGKTPMFFAEKEKFYGIIAVADAIKQDSAQAISELKNLGMRVVMLTGDNKRTANAVGKAAGVDEILAECLPGDKNAAIASLKSQGSVIMVGDGINDAPALTIADIGVAIGAGSDIAIESADIVLIGSSLAHLPKAILLSRETLKIIHQNLFWAFFYNAVGIPLAAGAFISLFGWQLNPMFGAAAMSLSSFCVVTNALRINLTKIFKKEQIKMQKELIIEGMMCPHCENRVKTVLESQDYIETAVVSHKDGTAKIILSREISNDILISLINAQGYKVKDIK